MTDEISAQGRVFTNPNNASRFGINVFYRGHLYQYFGSFSSSVPNFVTSSATMKFTNGGQFSGYQNVSGRLGPKGITLVLSNGPTLEGVLDKPLTSSTVVSGTGFWGEI